MGDKKPKTLLAWLNTGLEGVFAMAAVISIVVFFNGSDKEMNLVTLVAIVSGGLLVLMHIIGKRIANSGGEE